MRIDFARLNYVLIPKTKEGRDRFRHSRAGRVLAPIVQTWNALTEEGRALLVTTFGVGAVAVDVRNTSSYVLFAVLFAIVFGAALASRRQRARGATVHASAPRRVTVGETVTFTIACKNEEDVASPPIRIRGPFLTWDGTWLTRPPAEIEVGPRTTGEVTMTARFVARGLHHLDPFTAAAVAPLGLSCGPSFTTEPVKVHVVPRVPEIARLPVTIASRHQPGGVALASKSGESMDLLGVRPYRPGDPVRDLHAKSWARTGIPVVREYQQEYFTRVGVVLDTDTRDHDLLDHAVELAAGVVAHLSRGETLVDVLVVGETVHELTVGRSLGFFEQALELLADVERGPKLRAGELVRRLEPHLAQLSTVIAIMLPRAGDADGGGDARAFEQRVRERGVACTILTLDADVREALRKRTPLSW